MSNLWFNVRIGVWHIQAEYESLWKWNISNNSYWSKKWIKNPIAVYDIDIIGGWERRKDGVERVEEIK